ncbi:MAG TPA: RNA-binding protein [Candidatus Magasanikbacteria bacterium]|nr:RNA-binding protein [Candidatus Magasanikbacteria bacterium]
MSKQLYVGGLPYSSTEDSVRAAFEQAGAVSSVKIMTDKFTGRSRGFGFVEMADEAGAAAAIEMWDDKEFEGRRLKVNEARPLEDRPPRRNDR